MKVFAQLLSAGLLITCAQFANAQNQGPAPSPFCKIEQKVGLTDVTVEYSRPGVKDRKIFGDLVPYDKPWRTGANSATKFTFSTDVTVGGKELAAGSYAVITVPGKENWEVRFYPHESTRWNTYVDDENAKPVVVTAETGELSFTLETFVINLDHLRDNSATIVFAWENTVATVGMTVP